MLIKLNSKLLNSSSLMKLNKHLLGKQPHSINQPLFDIVRRSSSISITLKEDEIPVIRNKYEKLYENKYFKNKNKDEFKSKLVDYFDEVGIDYTKMITKINHLDHPSIKAISFFANNYDNELVQIKKLILNLFTHSLNQVYGGDVSQTILNSQLMVAELVQLLHIVHQIHGNLIHLSEFESKSLHDGNKLSILSGDFLFAIVMKLLAKISNNNVTISITDAVNSMNIGQFVIASSADELLDNMNANKWSELIDQVYAFSFRKGCESIAELIDTSVKIKTLASDFGRNFALALQASTELDQLKKFISLNSQTFLTNNHLDPLSSSSNSQFNLNSSSTYPSPPNTFKSDCEIETLHPILNLSNTYIDLFQLPIILDSDNLPALLRKVKNNTSQSNSLKPVVSYEILKNHLNANDFPKTMQFIQLYANKSIQCLDKLFEQSNHLETNELLKDFVYTCLYFNKNVI